MSSQFYHITVFPYNLSNLFSYSCTIFSYLKCVYLSFHYLLSFICISSSILPILDVILPQFPSVSLWHTSHSNEYLWLHRIPDYLASLLMLLPDSSSSLLFEFIPLVTCSGRGNGG